jgi:hypothetical protein
MFSSAFCCLPWRFFLDLHRVTYHDELILSQLPLAEFQVDVLDINSLQLKALLVDK